MNKLKLKPSLREKRHYLLLKPSKKVSRKDLVKKVDKAILNFIGILGYSFAGPIYVSVFKDEISKLIDKQSLLIVSVKTKYVDHVKSALTLYKEKSLSIECIRVSGTLKKLKEFIRSLD
ncbi:MAG: hypothetical protein JSW08_01755 [archaeon]|nr:MAG: hypothetical protein JSW08_01755 [archaeon]